MMELGSGNGTDNTGEPVVLLHGGMESSLSWGNQVQALVKTHHQVILIEVAARLAKDYTRISPTPDEFGTLHQALETMQRKEPNYTMKELAAIKVSKIAIAEGDHEEFITRAQTKYLAATIPGAKLIILPNVSHFAPWQHHNIQQLNHSIFSTINLPD